MNLHPMFSLSRMEKFTLKAGSMFLSEAFQFIIAEKFNIQTISSMVWKVLSNLPNKEALS